MKKFIPDLKLKIAKHTIFSLRIELNKTILKTILKMTQTVFSFKELRLHFQIDDKLLRSRLNYYVKNGDLYHLRRGLYAKDKKYNQYEVATKIFIPSYISFETVLVNAGIIFQYYSQIFVASYQSREITCDNQSYVFRRIKSDILTNTSGIHILNNYSIASSERAFLDMIYIFKDYYFDNFAPIDWKKVFEILKIYRSNAMNIRVNKLYHYAKEALK